MIGNISVSKDGKNFVCVWLGRLEHDLREYQFSRVLLAKAQLNGAEH